MVLPNDLRTHINGLIAELKQLTAISLNANHIPNSQEYDRRYKSCRTGILKIFRDGCALVREKTAENSPHLAELVEIMQRLFDKCIEYAQKQSRLFEILPSWAHDDAVGHPIVLDTLEGELPFPASIYNNFLQSLGIENWSQGQHPQDPWKNTSWRHPKASRLARFRPRKVDLTPLGASPTAKFIYDARCEIQSKPIPLPIDMYVSRDNACLAVNGASRPKQRVPYLEYYLLEGSDTSTDFPAPYYLEPGFVEIAPFETIDARRRLILLGDDYRIKSFAWAAPNGEIHEKAHPTHTLASGQDRGPITVLPNGTILRAGNGRIAVWNMQGLATHGPSGKDIIGARDRGILRYAWRGDLDEIELSFGSPPSSHIQLGLTVGRWKPLIQAPSTMLCETNSYGCATIDMEHGGSVVSRYLGHGGTNLTDFSLSEGDPQVFVTAAADGFARMFDIRVPLPVLTFDACCNNESCDAAVLAHPDGIPTLFTGTGKAEQIKMWDVRARTPVYELATGNTRVQALAWDSTRNYLYAATESSYQERFGNLHSYRYAKRTRAARLSDSDDESEDEFDEDELLDSDKSWPMNAYHKEDDFGYMFDAGGHRVYRYAFKENPNASILPKYGDAQPGREPHSYW